MPAALPGAVGTEPAPRCRRSAARPHGYCAPAAPPRAIYTAAGGAGKCSPGLREIHAEERPAGLQVPACPAALPCPVPARCGVACPAPWQPLRGSVPPHGAPLPGQISSGCGGCVREGPPAHSTRFKGSGRIIVDKSPGFIIF